MAARKKAASTKGTSKKATAKKATPKKATTKTATAKKATAKKATPKPQDDLKPGEACPNCGANDWDLDDAEPACRKCHEPHPTKSSSKPKASQDSKPAPKMSAINAAAQVLQEDGGEMNSKAMIEAIKDLWQSPGGKTPHATLYSAILREINTKGEKSRFVKAKAGHFKFNPES